MWVLLLSIIHSDCHLLALLDRLITEMVQLLNIISIFHLFTVFKVILNCSVWCPLTCAVLHLGLNLYSTIFHFFFQKQTTGAILGTSEVMCSWWVEALSCVDFLRWCGSVRIFSRAPAGSKPGVLEELCSCSDIPESDWGVQLSWEGVGVAVMLKLLNISLMVCVPIFDTFSIVIGRIQNELLIRILPKATQAAQRPNRSCCAGYKRVWFRFVTWACCGWCFTARTISGIFLIC